MTRRAAPAALAVVLLVGAGSAVVGSGVMGIAGAADVPPGSDAPGQHDGHGDHDAGDHDGGTGHAGHDGHDDHVPVAAGPGAAPDAVITGPQGAEGQFVVECALSHTASDDPIVHAGHAGVSHLHDFFGNEATGAASTYDELLAATTTCQQRADTAAYWVPALLDGDGEPIEPVRSVAYYRAGRGVDPATVQPYPPDLKIVAGDAAATGPQPTSVVAWTCNAGGTRHAAPPDCGPDAGLRLLVTFPDCWDGERADSDDHRSHMAYSHGGECGDEHPVPVPQLQFAVDYPIIDDEAALRLASGPVHTAHADFWNAWDQDKLEHEIELCVVQQHVCGISHRRAAQP